MTKIQVFQVTEEDKEDVSACKTRLRYKDVYSDTDYTSEEEVLSSEKILSACSIKTPSDLFSGMYVLVEVPCEQVRGKKSKGGKMYRYAAICQGCVDNENYASVMFLKSHGSNRIFIADNDDINKTC
ncbi:hypothetical protein J6590_025735 [Homalodisca vitripennis]|nr:hypothetical protein J6590_025735 [Homalodisca vitripennis]